MRIACRGLSRRRDCGVGVLSRAIESAASGTGDRDPSVAALRRDVADAQRRAQATAVDLGDRVRARITMS
jgi:hypothetical protein